MNFVITALALLALSIFPATVRAQDVVKQSEPKPLTSEQKLAISRLQTAVIRGQAEYAQLVIQANAKETETKNNIERLTQAIATMKATAGAWDGCNPNEQQEWICPAKTAKTTAAKK